VFQRINPPAAFLRGVLALGGHRAHE
jgi:hypothetical protein